MFGQFFFNFNIIFLATWGCASDFLKMVPKFKMAAGQLQIFLLAQKLRNVKSEIIQITFPTIWRCASDFFKVLPNFKNGRHG